MIFPRIQQAIELIENMSDTEFFKLCYTAEEQQILKDAIKNIPDKTCDRIVFQKSIAEITPLYLSLEFGSSWNDKEQEWIDSDYRTVDDVLCDYSIVFVVSELKKVL